MSATDIFKPYLMKIEQVTERRPTSRRCAWSSSTTQQGREFTFRTGQFGEYSVFGEGECTFCIASPPTRSGYIECTFRKVGPRDLGPGRPRARRDDRLPRALRQHLSDRRVGRQEPALHRRRHRPAAHALRHLERARPARPLSRTSPSSTAPAPSPTWSTSTNWPSGPARADVKLITTVDPGGETPDWKGEIGFVPTVLDKAAPSSRDTVAVVCGPPIMIKFTFPVLARLGFAPGRHLSPPWKTA